MGAFFVEGNLTLATDGWDTFWSSATSDEVLVAADGQRNSTLDRFWREQLEQVAADARVIDVACGAGSVARQIVQNPALCVGVDLSINALSRLDQPEQGITPVAADSSSLPFPDQCFDFVFSQFGVEYAGIPGVLECSRILAPGGVLKFLSHCKDSSIQKSVARDLLNVNLTLTSNFFPAAVQLAQALSSGEQDQINAAAEVFNPAEQQVRSGAKIVPDNFAGYTYLGFQKLLRQWEQHEPEDVISWLHAMRHEAESAAARLTTMQSAALDGETLKEINQALSEAGLPLLEKREVASVETNMLLAWELSQCQ